MQESDHICTTQEHIYKCIGKGTDQATVQLTTADDDDNETAQDLEDSDEILKYQNHRYIGLGKACSRIFEYSICYRYPAVMKLELHLENQHQVLFDPKQNKKELQTKLKKSKKTKLTEFFRLKKEDETSRYQGN